MDFEKTVLKKVSEITDDCFFYSSGVLSVICTQYQAKKILKKLTTELNVKAKLGKDGSYGFTFYFD
jgi:hypothetical protein